MGRKMIFSTLLVVAFMAVVSFGTTQIYDVVQSKDVDSLARGSRISYVTVMIGLLYLFCIGVIGSFFLNKKRHSSRHIIH